MQCLSACLSKRLPRTQLHTAVHTLSVWHQGLKFKSHILNLTARIHTSTENLTGAKGVTVSFSLACVYVYVCVRKLYLCICKWVCVDTLPGSWKCRLSTEEALGCGPYPQ